MLDKHGVDVRLNTRVSVDDLKAGGFDEVVMATGVEPRTPDIEGIDHPKVIGYLDALLGRKPVGQRVARSEEHTSELQSRPHLVCRLLLEKKKKKTTHNYSQHKRTNERIPPAHRYT